MSQHYFTTAEGRKVLYGLDKPTGGYFLTEFYKDDEIQDDEVKNSKSALTLTELLQVMREEYSIIVVAQTETLAAEWDSERDPMPMQYAVNKMFGKDLLAMLQRVDYDITVNFS
jgi:hypothetical protein